MQYQAILAVAALFASATALPAPGQATCPDPAGKCPEPDAQPLEAGAVANPSPFDPSTAKKDASTPKSRRDFGTLDHMWAPYPEGFDGNTCHGFGDPMGPPLTPSTNHGPDKAKRSDLVKRSYPEPMELAITDVCRWLYLQPVQWVDSAYDTRSIYVEAGATMVMSWAFGAALQAIHVIADLGNHFEYRASVRVKAAKFGIQQGIWAFHFATAGSYHIQYILDGAQQIQMGSIAFWQMANTGTIHVTDVDR